MLVSLSILINDHQGQTGWIIGKGRTDYDYANLATDVNGPVFFLNDAVGLEDFLPRAVPSYMTFLDHNQRVWLTRPLRSVVLCPHEHNVVKKPLNTVVVYQKNPDLRAVQRAAGTPLFVRRGTVCTMISFAWLTGVSRLIFIGCDGLNDSKQRPYDLRIENPSGGQPNWEYDIIKRCQEETCEQLGLSFEYRGTPNTGPRPAI